MEILNFWLKFWITSGVVFWMCIIASGIFIFFACRHAQEAPDEKIYEESLDNREL